MSDSLQPQRYVPIQVCGSTYLFDNQVVQSVALADDCERAATVAPNGLAGHMTVGGQDVPVLQLQRLLGVTDDAPVNREHLLVVSLDSGCCAFLVDDVSRAWEVAPGNLLPMPNLAQHPNFPYYRGVVRIQDENRDHDFDHGGDRTGVLLLSPHGLLGLPDDAPRAPQACLDSVAMRRATSDHQGKLLLFPLHHTLDAEQVMLGFSASEILEITRAESLIPVPRAPAALHGLLPWRNQFVPIVNIAEQLNLGELPTANRQRIIVVRSSNHQLFGFYASEDIRSLRSPIPSQPFEVPKQVRSSLIAGAYNVDGEGIVFLPSSSSLTPSSTVEKPPFAPQLETA